MTYKIVMDSCGELPEEYTGDKRFERVPLSLEVGDYCILDDENFNQAEFLEKVAAYPLCPKSSCPSPERFMEAFGTEAERVYVITLTSRLSGSHNSACLAKALYLEQYPDKKVHVIDSESASGGLTQIALKIVDMEEEGLPFEKIVEEAEKFRDGMNTYFVLDNLETLRKNGRLSGMKAVVASTLSIKPVMCAEKGVIVQRSQGIGVKKALGKMCSLFLEEVSETAKRRLIISHCNAPQRAEFVRKQIMEKADFRECILLDTKGVSSMYANDGGVIITA